jgi:hypothetical protein
MRRARRGPERPRKFCHAVVVVLRLIVVFVVLAGCAGTDMGMTDEERLRRPKWIESPPPDTSEYWYFLGFGEALEGDDAAALQRAVDESAGLVLSRIEDEFPGVVPSIHGLGTDSDSETASGQNDTHSVISSVGVEKQLALSAAELAVFREIPVVDPGFTESGITGFRPAGTVSVAAGWVERTGESTIRVFLLVRCDLAMLNDFVVSGEDVQRVPMDGVPVTELEADGDRLTAAGDLFSAVGKYLEAAAVVLGDRSESRNDFGLFKRILAKARISVGSISMVLRSYPTDSFVGIPFSEDIVVELRGRRDLQTGLVLPSVPLRLVVETVIAETRTVAVTMQVDTDEAGIARFSLEPPSFPGDFSVGILLDFHRFLGTWPKLPDEYQSELDLFLSHATTRSVERTYRIYARGADVPTGIMIFDVDRGNNPTGTAHAASQTARVLAEAGYEIVSLPLQSDLLGQPVDALVEGLDGMYGFDIDRVLFGVARIIDFQELEGRYTVKVSGDIRLVDLPSRTVLFSMSDQSRTALGPNTTTAMSAAFKGYGTLIGDVILNTIP